SSTPSTGSTTKRPPDTPFAGGRNRRLFGNISKTGTVATPSLFLSKFAPLTPPGPLLVSPLLFHASILQRHMKPTNRRHPRRLPVRAPRLARRDVRLKFKDKATPSPRYVYLFGS